MRQGCEGEKVSGKRDKMITVEKHSVWGTDVAVSARSASFGRDSTVIREQHSQNLDTCQERQNAR